MGRLRNHTVVGTLLLGMMTGLGCSPATPTLNVEYRPNEQAPPVIRDMEAYDPLVPYVPDGIAVLSGAVKNWITLTPVNTASLKSYGLAPQSVGVTDATGAYSVEVQAAGVFWVYAYKEGYTPTYNRIQMPAGNHIEGIYTVSEEQLDQLAQAFGVTRNPACATVLGRVLSPAAVGLAGVSELSVVGASYSGPYFLSPRGEAQANATQTSGSGQVVFFNVCDPDSNTLTEGLDAQIAAFDVGYVSRPQLLKLFPGRATRGEIHVLSTPENPDPNYEPVEPPPPDAPDPYVPDPVDEPAPVEDLVLVDFSTEIYPIFIANACAACHIRNSAAEDTELFFDAPPDEVYAMLREDGERVNLNEPAASTVLTMPLLESPPNHPNASFESIYSPDYQKILYWIEQGAPFGAPPPPPPVEAVYFYENVYGLLQAYDVENYPYGRGCANCHNAVDNGGDLDVTQEPAQVFQTLVDRNLYNVNYPERSSFLRNPYCGPTKCADDPDYPETHPTEVFATTEDPDYQTMQQWIAQGAIYRENPEPPPPELPQNVDFFDNVQPRFAKRGCTGCHNATSLGGGLDLTGLPALVFQRLTNPDYQRVVAGDYAGSYLYSKSLATAPDVEHSGGKTIPNADDDFARYVAGWIQQGALFNDPGPVDFTTDVLPYFEATQLDCIACHNQQALAGNLALDGSPAEVHNTLINGGYVDLTDPLNSSLLTKSFDLFPDVIHGGGKFALQDHYRAYHLMTTWIFEGAAP